MQRPTTLHTRTALLRDAIALMEAEYAGDVALDDVARRIATSRRQLQRCFAEHGEGSFRQCLTRIRMEHAAELLTGTSMTVRDVAARVGYRQQAQFAKAFARHHGMAPMQYRSRRALALAA
jgi:AraC family transcriptional regulator of adaptative response / methylphosphotriester-DNA alkyltransferase methyltransferase